ncbi:hypothetical protein EVAR_95785_1 [Eumeta japonica]|uniref:Uncharacterized protein n=1 Tax=Eumeta variegata TaxID=151549 RepID=A0A4C1W4N6_EUMVA|nr:hypothetical protein EVAR_95785_1 [Eumeta japonica]
MERCTRAGRPPQQGRSTARRLWYRGRRNRSECRECEGVCLLRRSFRKMQSSDRWMDGLWSFIVMEPVYKLWYHPLTARLPRDGNSPGRLRAGSFIRQLNDHGEDANNGNYLGNLCTPINLPLKLPRKSTLRRRIIFRGPTPLPPYSEPQPEMKIITGSENFSRALLYSVSRVLNARLIVRGSATGEISPPRTPPGYERCCAFSASPPP